jgi:hypothetical protein
MPVAEPTFKAVVNMLFLVARGLIAFQKEDIRVTAKAHGRLHM